MTYDLHVLVPSRGRPGNIERLWRAIIATRAAHPARITLRVRLDDDDPAVNAYPETHGDALIYTYGPRIRLAASWNEQAREAIRAGATHLALWGDDVVPETQGWDEKLIGMLDRYGPGFAYGRDGIWDHTYDQQVTGHLVLPTACIMSAELAHALGWVSPPGLVHLCVDLAWRDLGFATGSLFYDPGVLIRHVHRLTGAPDDQTYRDANDNGDQVRTDNLAFRAWREGKGFRADMETVTRVREAWRAGQSA